MSQDDDLIERIARLIYDADALRPRLTWERLTPLTQGEYRKEARAALSALPERELLAEALEALTFVVETRDCNHLAASDTFREYYAKSCPICRARAAADKIRDALTQEKQP